MILSSPFSRQNRAHQTWTNGSGGVARKSREPTMTPRPTASAKIAQNGLPTGHHQSAATIESINNRPFRTQTLNRLDMHRRKQQQHNPQQNGHLQRNLSSLGHYPSTQHTDTTYNGDLKQQKPHSASINHYKRSPFGTEGKAEQVYAPASIASPHEYNNNTIGHNNAKMQPFRAPQPQPPPPTSLPLANGDVQHYAATSYRGPTPYATGATSASESGRSGRESALGNLLERFTTLRRRARWSRSSSSSSSIKAKKATSTKSNGSDPTVACSMTPTAPQAGSRNSLLKQQTLPHQPVVLNPDIYATGKKKVEAEAIYAEGSSAIDSNIQKRLLEHELDESIMSEGETRTLIAEASRRQPDHQELVTVLINWLNDELSSHRIIVRDLQDDLYDGQILGKLVETLNQSIKIDIVEVTQNEQTQRYKLRLVLDAVQRILSQGQARWARISWSVDGIHGKNMVEIVHLLVTLALFFKAPIKLPPNVRCQVLVVQKHQGKLVKRSHEEVLTDSTNWPDANGSAPAANSRDAFDTLLEVAPEKLNLVRHTLVKFANRHLNKIGMSCADHLDPDQFSDGLLLVFLISSLEDYFVPFGNLFTAALPQRKASTELQELPDINNNSSANILQTALEPTSFTNTHLLHKLHNVNVALQLMEEAGLTVRKQVRAEDIVNGDLKAALRILYSLFSRYKHL